MPLSPNTLQKNPGYDRTAPRPPTAGLAALSMNTGNGSPISLNGTNGNEVPASREKLKKKDKHDGDGEKKKKRGFFGSKK